MISDPARVEPLPPEPLPPAPRTPPPRLLANRDFLLLWQGQLVSQLGNQAFSRRRREVRLCALAAVAVHCGVFQGAV